MTRFVILAVVGLVFFGEGRVLAKPPSIQPGTYRDWDGTIDTLTITRPFQLGAYKRIVVLPLDTSRVQLPPETENTFKPVKEVLAHSTEKFQEGIQRDLKSKQVAVQTASGEVTESIVIRGRVLAMDPGSQSARYWVGFSAGSARVQIEGEILDGRSKAILAQFKQERRSGAGLVGGGYHAVLDRSLREIGEDVASFLNAMR